VLLSGPPDGVPAGSGVFRNENPKRSAFSFESSSRTAACRATATPIAVGRPGNGQKCNACDEILTAVVLMMELTKGTKSFLLHGDCYTIWNAERLTLKS